MAEQTALSFGDSNRGFQVGQNSGSITAEFHLLPERLETPPTPSSTIPFRRDNDFVERKKILGQIHQACLARASRVALVGLGGVGKSQLAIEYAHRVRDASIKKQKTELWAFWVYAGTRARVDEGFKAIADAVKIPGRNHPKADILQLVYQWLQDERNGKWFMVLDNADYVDVFYDIADENANQTATVEGDKRALWTYFPQSSNGSILITTRNKELALRLTGGCKSIIKVEPMDQNHALELLSIKSGSQYDKDDGVELVHALEYLPLAISQAAAYIQRKAPRISVKTYLEELRANKESLLLRYNSSDLRRDRDASNSIITTWQLSFDYIRSKQPSATDLLSLLAFFDRQAISEYLVQPIHQNESTVSRGTLTNTFEEDIETLRNFCLIGINEAGNTFEMHRLVQLSTREWLDRHNETEKFKVQFISRLAKAFPSGDYQNWETCRQLLPHAEKGIHYCPANDEALELWALLLYNSSSYCREQGKHALAETMSKQAQEMCRMRLGSNHPLTLTSMSSLALAYKNQGLLNEAELLEMQVVAIRKTVLGPTHPDTIKSLSNLGFTYFAQGKSQESQSLGVEVLEAIKMASDNHAHDFNQMAFQGLAYWGQRRWQDAIALAMQGMEILRKMVTPESLNALARMRDQVLIYKNQGLLDEARSLEAKVTEASNAILGLDDPDMMVNWAAYACMIWNQGSWETTPTAPRLALETLEAMRGPDHPATLTIMSILASTYKLQGNWKEAESLEIRVIERRERVLGLDHPDTLTSMANLAFTYWDTGARSDDAFRWMERCAEGRARFLGLEHPDTRFAQSTLQKWRTGLPTPRTREHWRRRRLMITGTILLIYRACQIIIRSTMISIRAKSRSATMRNVD